MCAPRREMLPRTATEMAAMGEGVTLDGHSTDPASPRAVGGGGTELSFKNNNNNNKRKGKWGRGSKEGNKKKTKKKPEIQNHPKFVSFSDGLEGRGPAVGLGG